MANGDIVIARFGAAVTLLDDNTGPFTGLGNQLFKLEEYDNVKTQVINVTGGSSTMQIAIMVFGRRLS